MANLNDVIELAEAMGQKSVICIPARCVAVRNRNSSCKRCAEVCAGNAITVGDNKVEIDYMYCIECGACAAACPTEAMVSLDPTTEELALSVASAVENAKGLAVISCARMAARQEGIPEMYATVPCLSRIDEDMLIGLACRGIEDIVLVDGTCRTCKHRDAAAHLDTAIENARALLEACKVDAVITRDSQFPPEVAETDDQRALGASRRGFITQAGHTARYAAATAADQALAQALNRGREQKIESLRDQLKVSTRGTLPQIGPERNMRILDALYQVAEPQDEVINTRLFGSISIDSEKCGGCGMCLMFCPTGAIKACEDEHPDKEMRYVEFSVADCVQCRLCVDACLRKCTEVSSEVSVEELFDFEPRVLEIRKPQKKGSLFGRRK